jgi:hypothetical protein
MMHAVEISLGVMIHTPIFIKIGSVIQKVIGWDSHVDTQEARWSQNSSFILFSK